MGGLIKGIFRHFDNFLAKKKNFFNSNKLYIILKLLESILKKKKNFQNLG